MGALTDSQKRWQTYTMHISLDCAGHLEIDDKRNILHVDPTPREVRRD
jgi:hypothetical protein